MKSQFYYGGFHQHVAARILEYINIAPDFLSLHSASSPRAAGDALETLIAEKFDTFLGEWCTSYSNDFARRAMADVAFTDKQGVYSVVDVKTHREDAKFSMPNLTSVERLSRFYESDANVFSLIMVHYAIAGTKVTATDVIFVPIEFLDWNCLTVGALGWGQIQIRNANDIKINKGYSRKQWMLELCDVMLNFYPKEVLKIEDRITKFRTVKQLWAVRDDIWA